MSSQRDLITSIWQEIGVELESYKQRIYDEIKNYPSPITGCDQQFNYLLDEQTRVSQELGRMRSACQEDLILSGALDLIDAFLRSSSCIDVHAAGRIRAALREACSKPTP